jgi:hypothetical protein
LGERAAAGDGAAVAAGAAGAGDEARAEAEAAAGLRDDGGAVAGTAANMSSKVMDALIRLINRQSAEEQNGRGEAGQVEKILHSLLSSPCNFTPLLHFVVPAMLDDVKAFAEIWINPNDDGEDTRPGQGGRQLHLLLVIDVEMMGRFELELKVRDQVIDLALFCPAGYEGRFASMLPELPASLRNTAYRLGRMRVQALDHGRSLMEVFKSLPYKRVGVDVKI